MRWQLAAHLFLHLDVFRIVSKILPFPAVALVIVEFFGSIGVGDVAVAFGSQAVVLVAEYGERGLVSVSLLIFHQGREIISFQLPFGRLAARERSERGIDVE